MRTLSELRLEHARLVDAYQDTLARLFKAQADTDTDTDTDAETLTKAADKLFRQLATVKRAYALKIFKDNAVPLKYLDPAGNPTRLTTSVVRGQKVANDKNPDYYNLIAQAPIPVVRSRLVDFHRINAAVVTEVVGPAGRCLPVDLAYRLASARDALANWLSADFVLGLRSLLAAPDLRERKLIRAVDALDRLLLLGKIDSVSYNLAGGAAHVSRRVLDQFVRAHYELQKLSLDSLDGWVVKSYKKGKGSEILCDTECFLEMLRDSLFRYALVSSRPASEEKTAASLAQSTRQLLFANFAAPFPRSKWNLLCSKPYGRCASEFQDLVEAQVRQRFSEIPRAHVPRMRFFDRLVRDSYAEVLQGTPWAGSPHPAHELFLAAAKEMATFSEALDSVQAHSRDAALSNLVVRTLLLCCDQLAKVELFSESKMRATFQSVYAAQIQKVRSVSLHEENAKLRRENEDLRQRRKGHEVNLRLNAAFLAKIGVRYERIVDGPFFNDPEFRDVSRIFSKEQYEAAQRCSIEELMNLEHEAPSELLLARNVLNASSAAKHKEETHKMEMETLKKHYEDVLEQREERIDKLEKELNELKLELGVKRPCPESDPGLTG